MTATTTTTPDQRTFDIFRATDRGITELGWLHSRHSFSFGSYYNPQHMGYRALRVINDDIVEPGRGFGEHGHDNMEIISIVLGGALAHADSDGNRGVITPGDVQVMTAGSGIQHSEMNESDDERVHFLQIWIEPASRNVTPAYDQKHFPREGRLKSWQAIASPDARDGSLPINQDATLWRTELDAGRAINVDLAANRHGYIHVATGAISVGDTSLEAGDAIAFAGTTPLTIDARETSEILYFDLA